MRFWHIFFQWVSIRCALHVSSILRATRDKRNEKKANVREKEQKQRKKKKERRNKYVFLHAGMKNESSSECKSACKLLKWPAMTFECFPFHLSLWVWVSELKLMKFFVSMQLNILKFTRRSLSYRLKVTLEVIWKIMELFFLTTRERNFVVDNKRLTENLKILFLSGANILKPSDVICLLFFCKSFYEFSTKFLSSLNLILIKNIPNL